MAADVRHYLDHACFGPPSARTLAAIHAHTDALTDVGDRDGSAATLSWIAARSRARERVGALIGGDGEDIALVESTTHGLQIVAAGLPVPAGSNVVAFDCEFFGLITPWRAAEKRGAELRPVASRRGIPTIDDLVAAVDHNTRVITVSAVQEVSGARLDLAAVAEVARRVDAVTVVDGIQEAGVLARNVPASGVDAYVAGGHKWLRNPFGVGFAWLSPRLRDMLDQQTYGYLGLAEPAGGWVDYLGRGDRTAFDALPNRLDAAALEIGGTPNWLGSVGLSSSIDELLTTGIANVERRSVALAAQLRTGLAQLGLAAHCLGSTQDSAILTFGLPGGSDQEVALHRYLSAAGFQVSLRRVAGVGGVRASCHISNTQDDVAAFVDATAAFLKGDHADM